MVSCRTGYGSVNWGYDCHTLPASDASYCLSSFHPEVTIMAIDVPSLIEYWGARCFYNFHKKFLDGVYLCDLVMWLRFELLDVWVAVRFLMYHNH